MDVLKWLRNQWDRVVAVLLVATGALTLLVGWLRLTSTVYPAEQLPYLMSGGLGALFLLGLGATVWLSADLRDEWRKLAELDESVRTAAETASMDAE